MIAVKPCIEDLKQSNIRISDDLIQKVLQEANEN
jgi:predicted nucleic acid-binding protein